MNNKRQAMGNTSGRSRPWQLLVLSARSSSDLEALTDHLFGYFKQNPSLNLADVAYTLQVDRQAFSHRRMLVCNSVEDAIRTLETRDSRRLVTSIVKSGPFPIAFLFPGLGDHYVNMARELYRREIVFQKCIDRCSSLLMPLLGLDLRDVIYPERLWEDDASQPLYSGEPGKKFDLRKMLGRSDEPPGEATRRLNQTYLAQPALFMIEYALAQLWMNWGIHPQAMLGYSVGEYVAACLSGVFSLEDALALVARRAQMIQELPQGSMLAVALSEQEVQPLLTRDISLAAINGPSLCVLAGPTAAISNIERRVAASGVLCRRIQTIHAFHSHMMQPIAEEFADFLQGFRMRPPTIPYLSNVTGTWVTDQEATDPDYWVRHLCQTVRFADGMHTLCENASYALLEVGPGQTVSSLALQHLTSIGATEYLVLPSMRSIYEEQHDLAVLLHSLGRFWLAGVQVNWSGFYEDESRCRLPLPTGRYSSSDRERGFTDSVNPSDRTEADSSDNIEAKVPSNLPARRATRRNLLTTYVAPTNTVEQKITSIWQAVLNIEAISIYDNFFELGGHSLLAIKIISLLQETFHVDISLKTLFSAGNIADLAEVIQEMQESESRTPVEIPVQWLPESSAEQKVARSSMTSLCYTLPNGMHIEHQSKAETDHFYEDIFQHEVYIQHGIVLNDEDCVFDVGANIGLFTLFVHHKHKNCNVYAFEPAPSIFDLLCKNVATYGVNAKLFNVGLSNETRTATLTFYPHSSGMSSFYANREEEEETLRTILQNQFLKGMAGMGDIMQYSQELLEERSKSETLLCHLRTLSDIILENDVQCIDLLKIDAQKSEFDILMGIKARDWSKIKQVVLEVHDIEGRVNKIISLLNKYGFTSAIAQDDLYRGSNIYVVYAIRS